jgi:hypothetical protein
VCEPAEVALKAFTPAASPDDFTVTPLGAFTCTSKRVSDSIQVMVTGDNCFTKVERVSLMPPTSIVPVTLVVPLNVAPPEATVTAPVNALAKPLPSTLNSVVTDASALTLDNDRGISLPVADELVARMRGPANPVVADVVMATAALPVPVAAAVVVPV